jgi:hypothetical protein
MTAPQTLTVTLAKPAKNKGRVHHISPGIW